jgi:hypothetical protein
MADADRFVRYTVILVRGALSPAEDLETAIIAAAQSEACGETVARIECGTEVILEGGRLRDAIAKHARQANGDLAATAHLVPETSP